MRTENRRGYLARIRAGLVLTTTLAVGLTAACTVDQPEQPDPVATSEVTEAPAPAPLDYFDAPDNMGPLRVRHASFDIGLDTSVTRTDKYGSWHPAIPLADSALLTLPGELLPPGYTRADIEPAYQMAVNYLITEFMDSELLWDDSDASRLAFVDRLSNGQFYIDDAGNQDWWIQSVHRIGGNTDEAILTRNDYPSAFNPQWTFLADQNYQDWKILGYPDANTPPLEAPKYSPEVPRYLLNEFRLVDVTPDPEFADEIAFDFNWQYFLPAQSAECPSGCGIYRSNSLRLQLIIGDEPTIISWEAPLSPAAYGKVTSFKALTDESPTLPPGESFELGQIVSVANLSFEVPTEWTLSGGGQPETAAEAEAEADDGADMDAGPQELSFRIPPVADGYEDNTFLVTGQDRGTGSNFASDIFVMKRGEELWTIETPEFTGSTVIATFPRWDYISLEFSDPHGYHYTMEARVPSGDGFDVTTQLVSGLSLATAVG